MAIQHPLMQRIFKIYVIIATIVGTITLSLPVTGPVVYGIYVIAYNGMAPAPLSIILPNKFVYDTDHNKERLQYALFDKDPTFDKQPPVVNGDVRDIMLAEDYIYGYRREYYYFICQYGHDCSDTQHLKRSELDTRLEALGLPQYNWRDAKSYDQLLPAYAKTWKGTGG
mgnify:CR=1 FL=1